MPTLCRGPLSRASVAGLTSRQARPYPRRNAERVMKIGVPKEIKIQEYRVGLTPAAVRELSQHGHHVLVEHDAGLGIGYDDDAYRAAGASIAETAGPIFEAAELIVKVKEPQPTEIARLRRGQILFT